MSLVVEKWENMIKEQMGVTIGIIEWKEGRLAMSWRTETAYTGGRTNEAIKLICKGRETW